MVITSYPLLGFATCPPDRHGREVPAVQALWVQGRLSAMQRLALRSFLANGHAVDLYTYEVGACANLPAGVRLLAADEVIPEAEVYQLREAGRFSGSWASFANLFRYKLLLDKGGWWVDLDTVCLRGFDFSSDWVFASQRRRAGSAITANCIIRAPAGSSLMSDCYEQARMCDQSRTQWGITGPMLLHKLVQEHGLSGFIQPPEYFCPLDWWRAERLRQVGTVPTSAYALHLWHEMWRQHGWTDQPAYERGVIYEQLHARYPEADEG